MLAGMGVTSAVVIAADYGSNNQLLQPLQPVGQVPAASSLPTAPAAAPTAPLTVNLAAAYQGWPGSATVSTPAPIGSDPGRGLVRLPGHVLDVIARAEPIATVSPHARKRMTLTLTLKRDDQFGFDRYLQDVYDPQSLQYRRFLTQSELTHRYGPSRPKYNQVSSYLRQHGLTVVTESKNRLTLSVRGSRQQVEDAFALHINDYRIGKRRFHANDADPALPPDVARTITGIQGFSNFAQPERVVQTTSGGGPGGFCTNRSFSQSSGLRSIKQGCSNGNDNPFLFALCLVELIGAVAFGFGTAGVAAVPLGLVALACLGSYLPPNFGMSGSIQAQLRAGAIVPAVGAGQKIGLLEFDSYNPNDVADFLTLIGSSAPIGNLTEVPVNGGTQPGSNQDEVLLDIDTVMTGAPGAKVTVYDAPFSGQTTSYTALFNAMLNDGVTIISNSWASCEDQISQADAQSIDSVLQSAAASGISVFNGSGDSGSTCLDGSASTVSVPADSPSATAVGGSTPGFGNGFTYGGDTWWNGTDAIPATGQGGFGVSKFFPRPSYQNGLATGAGRSVPDVVANADPTTGMIICQASAGGCPTGSYYGGTSLAAPEWAAYAALLNQMNGKNVGSYNSLIYPLANTSAFHSAASMGSDFAHVGLGSPSLGSLAIALSHRTVGLPAAQQSQVVPLLAAPVQVPGSTIPADGVSQGGVLVTLRDVNGYIVSGKTVTLTANGSHAVISPSSGVSNISDGAVAFTVTDLTAENLTLTATDSTDGIPLTQTAALAFGPPPAASGGISVNPAALPADGQTPATITVTLKDALNRPSPGKTVTIADAGAHTVITGPTPGVTDANGQIIFSATDQVNETVTLTATDVTDNVPVPGSGTVTYSGSTFTGCNIGVVPVAGTGYSVTPYITGLPAGPTLFYGNANIGCPGGEAPSFTSNGKVLVSDFLTGNIYELGLAGGAVSSSTLLSTLTPALGTLVFGKDGSLYATLGNEGGEIIQIDPTTGTQLRVVASNLTCPAGLSVDPLSGDLFFDDQCTGGGTDNASVYRVIDPANTNAAAPTTVVVYATLPNTPNGGMAFAPNGTLYAVSGYYNNPLAPVEQISGTNAATVTVTAVAGVTTDYAVAVGATNTDGSAQSLIVEPSGNLSEVPLANPSAAVVLASGSPGVGVIGPDGCMYSARYDTVYRLANGTSGCSFTATSPAPAISLAPATITPNPAQGSSQTFTATLKNVATAASTPVYFKISGANPQVKLTTANANGSAAITYTAAQSGIDTVIASATTNSVALSSNAVEITWVTGKHVTFVSLNTSPQGGTVNLPVNVTASLSDVSASPAGSLAGQIITFALGGSSCTATTNSSGIASCPLTPLAASTATLTASFAGNSSLTAAEQSVGFNVSLAPIPPPTVAISVSPTTIAAGSTATLTWSSSNATACTASGSWSGSEPTSGKFAVTPTTSGSDSYTLTCTNAGGSSAATAMLSATLVAVSVTAKSGGGAMTWYLLLVLGMLVLGRMYKLKRPTCRSISGIIGLAGLLVSMIFALAHSARAAPDTPDSADWITDGFYDGIRVGAMPARQSASHINVGLADRGFGDVTASSDNSGTAGTVFWGYEFMPHTGVELAYIFREATAARLSGTIPSAASLTPLLQSTTGLIRGYGNIVSVSYAGHFGLLSRLSLEPRLGGFFWATKVSAIGFDDRIDATHEGAGVTAGLSAAYRLWRGLELGVSVDHYRGFPSNIATLYAGTVEWRFGH